MFTIQLSRNNGQCIEYRYDPSVDAEYIDVFVGKIHPKPVGYIHIPERTKDEVYLVGLVSAHHDRLIADVSRSFSHYQSRYALYGHEWSNT